MEAISASGLSKCYGDVVALRDVTFKVSRGEVIGLLGPNGAGKTTLMKILTGYLQPDEGQALVGGIDVVDDPLAVQQRIGYLPENAPLYGEMAVQEYLGMMAALRGIEESRRVRLLSEAVYATGLADYLTRPIQTLSKGYRQRVGIAQAILHRPELLILDEPTTGLDPNQIVEIRELIRELSEHSTVILSTHILSEVEMSCERVLIVMRGQVRADSRLADLRADSAAVVAVEAGAKAVDRALGEITGVQRVERLDQDGNYVRWRVSASQRDLAAGELCPAIHELVRKREWAISELRPDARTLESVFRSLAEEVDAGIVRDAGPVGEPGAGESGMAAQASANSAN